MLLASKDFLIALMATLVAANLFFAFSESTQKRQIKFIELSVYPIFLLFLQKMFVSYRLFVLLFKV
tara:strand:- start:860 stop:1057 length:198 start_codon:yes stop_codon:yes gene_type:complete